MGWIPVLLMIAVALSALFAGLETGFVSLNRVRLRVRARRGDRRAATLLKLLQEPGRVLSTFLIGNTLANIGGGALASVWAIYLIGNESVGSLVATVIMSAIFLIVSEVAPKTYFRLRAEYAVPRFIWFIRLAMVVFAPVVWVSTHLLRWISGDGGPRAFVTRDELRQLVREAHERLGQRERHMLESVFDFGRTSVREVMLPLPEVVSIAESASSSELRDLAARERHTRFPVYRNRVDLIVGLANVFDLLYDPEPKPLVRDYMRPVHVVPETAPIHRLLVDLQRRREAMALVVNEFGACVGTVTLEDIVEEITGDLVDEHEEPEQQVQRVSGGYLVEAGLDIDDLNDELGLVLPRDRVDTVGGLIMSRLGRIPEVGERVQVGDVEFVVLTVHPYGVKRVQLRVLRGGHGE